MNKLQFSIIFSLFTTTFMSCETNTESKLEASEVVAGVVKEDEPATVNDFELNMDFQDYKYIQNSEVDIKSQGGVSNNERSFAIVFSAWDANQKNKHIQLEFNLLDFEFKTGNVTVEKAMLIQSEPENELDGILYGKNIKMAITDIAEFENVSSMGLTVKSYKVKGTFSGVFKSMTGSEYKLNKGVFSNAIFSLIKTQ